MSSAPTVKLRRLFSRIDIRGADAPLASATTRGVELRSELGYEVWNPQGGTDGYKLVRPGDFVVGLRAFQHGLSYSQVRGLVSPAYTVFRASASGAVHEGYYEHYFRSQAFISGLASVGQGIRQGKVIDWEALSEWQVPQPALEEQRRIADFLDDQVTRIDVAVRAREVQAGLLNERWAAMLAREYSGPGTPSNLRPLKRVAWWREGPGILLEDFRDAGTPLLRIANVRGQEFSLDGCGYVDSLMAKRRWGHLAVRAGELLTSGSATGGLAVEVPPEAEGSIPYTGLIRIRPASPDVSTDFLRFFLLSPPFTEQVNALKTGIGIQHWGPYHLAQISISVPDTREQAAVVDRLGDGQQRVSTARTAVDSSSRLLQERKRSLITAAVTGEFDVSSAGPRAAAAVTG